MKKDVRDIQERNRRVELDKAWETSTTRKTIIAILTYLIVVVFLFSIGAPNPLLNAIVPTLGFVLSTLTLSFFKGLWIKHVYHR